MNEGLKGHVSNFRKGFDIKDKGLEVPGLQKEGKKEEGISFLSFFRW